MAFRVKLDEDLPLCIREGLCEAGYDALTVHDQKWTGLKDPVLWRNIVAEGRFFVTADKEFGDLRKFPPGSHSGILLLRAGWESGAAYAWLLGQVVKQHRLEALSGCVVGASPRGVRVRRPSQ